jgi:SAM-dependent methyltransferase
MAELNDIRETVRERYAAAATKTAPSDASCCAPIRLTASPTEATKVFGGELYDNTSREGVPDSALDASLGCGVPTAVADLHEGETVLDLGSGAGADVLISAGRIGPTGKAIGLDMTDEMLALARANAAGVENVEFVKGYLEEMPLPDASVDVVISNCVINLSGDKPKVISEAARVLRPGGRFRSLRRDLRRRHGRSHQSRHGRMDRLHRRRPHRAGIPRRTHRRRLRRHRDPTNPPRPRTRQRGDHPRPHTSRRGVLCARCTR